MAQPDSRGFSRVAIFSVFSLLAVPVSSESVSGDEQCNSNYLSQAFNGTPVDLQDLHNRTIQMTKGVFNNQSSRLLLGYGDDRVRGKRCNITSLTVSKQDNLTISNNSMIPADFGELDPSTMTHFQDIVFGNGKMFNITLGDFVDSIDKRIEYASGNHFDLENPISVARLNESGAFVGVVNGKGIYRQKCPRKRRYDSFLYDCSQNCQIAVATIDKDHCFYIDGCEIAFGPLKIFYDILVIPKTQYFRRLFRTPTFPPGPTTPFETTARTVSISETALTTTEMREAPGTPEAPGTLEAPGATEAPETKERKEKEAPHEANQGTQQKETTWMIVAAVSFAVFAVLLQ
ncbi:hypothetical protein L596_013625 [Steinernema carpocapsae]|uniref:Peptidase A1 domain-containing protein n=1 Tax=Steinernema carpocapsae TaxID=34508 RepID=A0A4U5P0Q7_STECR|nr:hypothetical protein L596_013625 [Steinernema carpocapsae]